jgi:hypothetical protein
VERGGGSVEDERETPPGSGVSRRDALKATGLLPLAAMLGLSPASAERAAVFVGQVPDESAGAQPASPKFFTAAEWRTVRVMADYVIPKDARSGSATDAKAPEFVDFMLAEKDTSEANRTAMRGGLAWIDTECRRRFGKTFVASSDAQRRQLLDDIAWPKKATPEMKPGATFFDRFRSVIGSAFFSSAMGWTDLQYQGNVFNPGWNGCPEPALKKLGVSYEEFDASLEARRKA